MKAKNNTEIISGYINFTIAITLLITIGCLILFCFIRTKEEEIACLKSKAIESGSIHLREIELVNKMDSLYNYISLLNSNEHINNFALQSFIVKRQNSFASTLKKIKPKSTLLYSKLSLHINTFLSSKDSIRTMAAEEQLLRSQLIRCIKEYPITKQKNRYENKEKQIH